MHKCISAFFDSDGPLETFQALGLFGLSKDQVMVMKRWLRPLLPDFLTIYMIVITGAVGDSEILDFELRSIFRLASPRCVFCGGPAFRFAELHDTRFLLSYLAMICSHSLVRMIMV